MLVQTFSEQSQEGLHHLTGQHTPDTYEKTSEFFVYEHSAFPNVLHTRVYRAALMSFWARTYGRPVDEVAGLFRAGIDKRKFLTDEGKAWHIILEEQVLFTQVTSAEDHVLQLRHLAGAMSLPNVVVGIIPGATLRDFVGSASFWVFDGEMVAIETPSASLTETDPNQVALYNGFADKLRKLAHYGEAALQLVSDAGKTFTPEVSYGRHSSGGDRF